MSGSVDFSTPAQSARDALLPYLPNGRQVVLAGMRHTSDLRGVQPEAAKRLLTSLYDTGVADDSLYTYMPMDFAVGMGFPALVKIGLGAGAALALVVAAAIVVACLIVRRVARRRAT